MDAKDRLRLYLEQRRELGESELVLDALPVDAVMRMLGAPLTPRTDGAEARPVAPGAVPPVAGAGAPAASHPAEPPAAPAAPGAEQPLAAAGDPPAGRAADSPAAAMAGSAPEVAPPELAPPPPPPDPALRFDGTETTDWRAALQHIAPGAGSRSTPPAPGAVPVPVTSASVPSWLLNLGLPPGLSATAPPGFAMPPAVSGLVSLDDVAASVAGCRACPLGALAINPVPGEGNINADVVCVGEAPGQNEDETGRPFVGAAGQLLTKILAAIQLERSDVFICNVIKHRPPGNRNPTPDEVRACTPYLVRQLELLKPKVILALGTFAAQTLLATTTPLGKLRGQLHRYQGIPLIVTYHPAALLRNESWKRPTWDDVKLVRRVLDAARAAFPES